MTQHESLTIQNLLERLDRPGYSTRTIAQFRLRIKTCAALCNRPLDPIPADLATFEARCGKDRVAAIPAGFRPEEHFREFRQRVRNALAGIHLPAQRTDRLPFALTAPPGPLLAWEPGRAAQARHAPHSLNTPLISGETR